MNPIPYFYEPINRSVILVKAKQPFFDWMNKLDPENPVNPPIDGNAYLVKRRDYNKELEKWLKRNFDKIFVNELNDWFTNEEEWPQKRTLKLFNEWFEVSMQSSVLDMEETMLI